jgi:hypothetical protein
MIPALKNTLAGLSLATLALCLPLETARAQSAAADTLAPDLPPLVAQAFAASSVTVREEDWRFSLTLTSADGVLEGVYDGSRPEGERWVLVSPAENELEGIQEQMWAGLIEDEDEEDEDGADSGLFFDAEENRVRPGSVQLIEEDATHAVFAFRPDMGEDDEGFAEFIRGSLTVSRDPALGISQYRLWAPESFKPHFAVRINAFEMVQEYRWMDGVPAPVMTRLSQQIEGRAAFQNFDQSFELVFSDIEYLGESPR